MPNTEQRLREIEEQAKRAIDYNVDSTLLSPRDIDFLIRLVKRYRTALEFYAQRKCWSEFISEGGVFDEIAGDMVEAFQRPDNQLPDAGATAREALSEGETE